MAVRTLPDDTTNGIAALNVNLASGAISFLGATQVFNKETGVMYQLSGVGAAAQFAPGGGSSGPASALTPAAFSAVVPLDGSKYMPDTVLYAAQAFSAAGGSLAGGYCKVALVSDGDSSHIPTFTGFALDPSSDQWNATLGEVHNVYFYNDGTRNLVTLRDMRATVTIVANRMLAAAPTTAFVGRQNGPIQLSVNGSLLASVTITPTDGAGGTFAPSTVTLTPGAPTGTTLYTPSAAGAKTISYSNTGALTNPTNSVAATVPVVTRIGTLTGMTESGDATNGWNYTTTGSQGNYTTSFSGIADKKIPSGQDGFFEIVATGKTSNTVAGPFLGLKTTQVAGAFTDCLFGGFPGNTVYLRTTAGTQSAALVSVAAENNDRYRIGRAGTVGYLDVTKDGGVTWGRVHSLTVTTADLFLSLNMGLGTANNVTGSGVA